jgi:cation diffusion facilitator CzcD-associated flavoprotein CzcO
MTRVLPTHTGVLVVGAGFGGICAAVRLSEAGRDVVVVEKADEVGGTWRDNSYPACACDVPSHLYSFSFAPNPDWSRTFSPQPEIFDYLRRVADAHGVRDRTWFGTEVLDASWDGTRWQVRTSSGDLTAAVLLLATGGLSNPAVPDVPGLEGFTGACFHSAQWDHSHDFRGERVAVIGTGASAIQFAPEVAREAAQLTVFQRTAPWVLPRRDRAIRPVERWLYRHIPVLQKLMRVGIYSARESWVLAFRRPSVMSRPERMAKAFIGKHIDDPELRARVTPHYRLGCKRVLLSNTWYPMLAQQHVSLVTDPIIEVRPTSVVTRDGDGDLTEHEVDTILLGTGFTVTDPPISHRIRNEGGSTLAASWAETGLRGYQGLTVEGFANLFVLTGPNTGLGHTSVVYVIERQVEHVVRLLDAMSAAGVAAIQPRPDVVLAYNNRLQRALAPTVWNAGGCSSWYLDRHGVNTVLWPTFTFTMAKELRRVELDDYVCGSAVGAGEAGPAESHRRTDQAVELG